MKMRKLAAILRAVLGRISSRAGQFFVVAPLVMVPFLTPVAASAEETAIEEVVVTGVRGKPRTVQDSPVPIDVFDQQTIESVNVSSMNDIIRTLVPSFGLARQPISDGATFVRPASVRGLSNDKTLVLVNSKRRHRSMLVNLGSGAQGRLSHYSGSSGQIGRDTSRWCVGTVWLRRNCRGYELYSQG